MIIFLFYILYDIYIYSTKYINISTNPKYGDKQ